MCTSTQSSRDWQADLCLCYIYIPQGNSVGLSKKVQYIEVSVCEVGNTRLCSTGSEECWLANSVWTGNSAKERYYGKHCASKHCSTQRHTASHSVTQRHAASHSITQRHTAPHSCIYTYTPTQLPPTTHHICVHVYPLSEAAIQLHTPIMKTSQTVLRTCSFSEQMYSILGTQYMPCTGYGPMRASITLVYFYNWLLMS